MNYYLEYGGGLGDVFVQLFKSNSYSVLDEMRGDERATVVLVTHNPYVRELFDFHPNGGRILVRDLGFWLPESDAEMRRRHGLRTVRPSLPCGKSAPRFHPTASDADFLDGLSGKPYVVFSVSAGLSNRSIPVPIVKDLAARARQASFIPVFTGRTYDRHGRTEFIPAPDDGVNSVDKLSVPGVARLVCDAAGLVCCHSALNLLAWKLRKPQLLLYPPSVYERHFSRRDAWSFGIGYTECHHSLFDDLARNGVASRFFSSLTINRSQQSAFFPPSLSRRQSMKSIPFPKEALNISVDETIGRLTPPNEVKYLCWLTRRTKGNIVEIGCNKGLTTRDLAAANPDKIVYAIDYFAADHNCAHYQAAERTSAQEFCVHARGMSNVVCIHGKSSSLNYEAFKDVGMVFIDGDHTYDCVKADTENALAFFQKTAGGTLVWHDYYAEAPAWVGVKKYVDALDLPIEVVDGTWLAVAHIAARKTGRASAKLK